MNASNPPSRYSAVAMALHWLIAALILLDFALAISFAYFNPGDTLYFSWAYDAHMQVGLWLLVACVLRLGWRLVHPVPALPAAMGTLARLAAKATHAILYVFMFTIPITGWIVLSTRRTLPVLFGDVRWPAFAGIDTLSREWRVVLYKPMLPGHIWLSYIVIGFVAVHVLAALYHHYYRRDDVLRRMLPWTRLRDADPADRRSTAGDEP